MNPSHKKIIDMPFAYQWDGAMFLSTGSSRLLADDMGLGKTVQTIMAADIIDARKVLVICPAIARFNWQNEFRRWGKRERDFKVILSAKDSNFTFEQSVICSFDFASEYREKLVAHQWAAIIVDEVHMLKNHESKSTHSFFNAKNGLIKNAKYFWALSGTPAPNNISELWVMLRTCGITKLSFDDFVLRYCTWYTFNGRRVVTGTKKEMIPEIQQMLKPFMLRRKTVDVLKELPKIFMQDLIVEPGFVDTNASQSFVKYSFPIDRRDVLAGLLEKDEEKLRNTDITDINKLMAMAKSVSTLRRYTGTQKVENTVKIIKQEFEDKAYEKLVIFAVHKDCIDELLFQLHDYKPVVVYGGTPAVKREMRIHMFQNDPECKIFIGNIQAAGTNITLTAANEMILLEQSWVPGENAQALKRCNRIGSTKPLRVRVVGLANSMDQKIAEVLRKKINELAMLFDGDENLELQDFKDEANNENTNRDTAQNLTDNEQQQIADMLK